MPNFLGHVDRVDQFLIAGWALVDTNPEAQPEIRIVQQGRVVVSLRPAFLAPQLRSALRLMPSNAPPMYAWRLWFPLSNGVTPGIPFNIVFSESNSALALGQDRTIELTPGIDAEARTDLVQETLVFPSVKLDKDSVRVWWKVAGPTAPNPPQRLPIELDDRPIGWLERSQEPFLFDKPVYTGRIDLSPETLFPEDGQLAKLRVGTGQETPRAAAHNSIRTLVLPRTVFRDPHNVPDLANIHRVSGPTSDQTQYLVGGVTTFLQLEALSHRYFGRSVFSFPMVVDWGVGCARVMRNFFDARMPGASDRDRGQRVLGLDIDEVNIDWCNANLSGLGQYERLGFEGFELESASVDFLYGISVMTHLTEFHQHLWLAEIARVLKPGGCAVLTTHGEFVVYGEYALSGTVGISTPFVDKFGFFDGVPDNALGDGLDTYYRATYHARRYIRENWGRYLEVLDIVPAANAFRQDFVVLKKKLAT